MNCATSTIKYLVFIFNTLCALVAIGGVVIGSIALSKGPSDTKTGVIFFIVVSAIVVLISVCGCLGAVKENSCLTWTYATFMLLLLIANLVIQFTAFWNVNYEKEALDFINKRWDEQQNGKGGMDTYQTSLQCCGRKGPNDYINLQHKIPDSCYPKNQVGVQSALYQTGCISALTDLYNGVLKWSKAFMWATFGIELAALVSAIVLIIAFKNDRRRANY